MVLFLPEGGEAVGVHQREGAEGLGVELVQLVALQAKQAESWELQQGSRVEKPQTVVVQVKAEHRGEPGEGLGGDLT